MTGIGGRAFVALIVLGLPLTASDVSADTLKRVAESGVIRIGHRSDALPHSYVDQAGRPAGYIVDLCREVAVSVQERLKPAPVRVEFVRVTAQDRFEAVREHRVDLLCEPSSITLARRNIVDFSIPTFVDGAGVAFRDKEVTRFEDFAGRKIGVLGGTTTHDLLREALSQMGVKAEIVVTSDHGSGMRLLADGKVDAYFADRAILAYLYSRYESNRNFKLGRHHFSYETYGLALERGDVEFRWLVDRTLARLARDGRMAALAARNFGISNDELLNALIVVNSLPD
jgi:polar amino acid transport system substrate-binding protein